MELSCSFWCATQLMMRPHACFLACLYMGGDISFWHWNLTRRNWRNYRMIRKSSKFCVCVRERERIFLIGNPQIVDCPIGCFRAIKRSYGILQHVHGGWHPQGSHMDVINEWLLSFFYIRPPWSLIVYTSCSTSLNQALIWEALTCPKHLILSLP
jgi:hypothetical protein